MPVDSTHKLCNFIRVKTFRSAFRSSRSVVTEPEIAQLFVAACRRSCANCISNVTFSMYSESQNTSIRCCVFSAEYSIAADRKTIAWTSADLDNLGAEKSAVRIRTANFCQHTVNQIDAIKPPMSCSALRTFIVCGWKQMRCE